MLQENSTKYESHRISILSNSASICSWLSCYNCVKPRLKHMKSSNDMDEDLIMFLKLLHRDKTHQGLLFFVLTKHRSSVYNLGLTSTEHPGRTPLIPPYWVHSSRLFAYVCHVCVLVCVCVYVYGISLILSFSHKIVVYGESEHISLCNSAPKTALNAK